MTVTDLLREVEELMSATAGPILGGQCTSYEEYKSRTARLRAFQEVLDLTKPERKRSESPEG